MTAEWIRGSDFRRPSEPFRYYSVCNAAMKSKLLKLRRHKRFKYKINFRIFYIFKFFNPPRAPSSTCLEHVTFRQKAPLQHRGSTIGEVSGRIVFGIHLNRQDLHAKNMHNITRIMINLFNVFGNFFFIFSVNKKYDIDTWSEAV